MSIHHQLAIRATRSQVYRHLSQPDLIGSWWGEQTLIDTPEGQFMTHQAGPYGTVRLQVLTQELDTRVVWACVGQYPPDNPASAWPGTQFIFDLSEGESGAALVEAAGALPGADREFVDAVVQDILPAFARADGISTRLSDSYRSGMVANFMLSALAVIVGVAWLPFGIVDGKWVFALAEFGLLAAILLVTWQGGRRRLHGRWFQTRRVAEYLRHAPILLLVGVARPPSHWPRGSGSAWPEYAARHALREHGLPRMAVTPGFLRSAVQGLLAPHVASQRAYHQAKAKRLETISHRLDRLAVLLFKIAVAAVATWLLMRAGAALQLLPPAWPHASAKSFAFLGVALPTLGASIAGIRYFGDFERFAAISEVTAGKLAQVEVRIGQLLAGPDVAIDYEGVSRLAHAIDGIVVDEIESWQAVFSGKPIALPA